MSNERLRAAIDAAGLTVEQLAEQIEVDAKTIERWINRDRTPYPRHRHAVARALHTTPHDLWPDAETTPEPEVDEPSSNEGDLVAAAARPEQLDIDHRAMLAGAQGQIDILGFTLRELIDPETVDLLEARADAGCSIRILVADPDSIHLHVQESEHHPDLPMGATLSTLRYDAERTLGYLQPLLTRANVEVRLHVASRANSILRADDQMLITLHLFAGVTGHEPTLHLHERDLDGLFASFAAHYDAIWDNATHIVAHQPDRYPQPDANPDRYRYPDYDDLEIPITQWFTPDPPVDDSAEASLERQPPRTRRLRKPRH